MFEFKKIKQVFEAMEKKDLKKAKDTREQKKIKRGWQKHFEELEKMEQVETIPKEIELTNYWSYGSVYGAQAKAGCYFLGCGYYEGSKTTGCGYDKRSTAAAYVLYKCRELKALYFNLLEKQTKKTIKTALKYADLRGIFGYGLHFSKSVVYFGDGCGMSSIFEELEKVGYKNTARHESQKGDDYYKFELQTKELNKLKKQNEKLIGKYKNKIGIKSDEELKDFARLEKLENETTAQALRRYALGLGDDFKIKGDF